MSMSVPPSGSATSKLAFAGAVIGAKYRLEELIGYGGMGSVWSATHLGLGERIAIKLVSANFARSSEARRRFELEAKAAAKIKSRHVPHVFDNGVLDDGTPYLAMELLQGESLAGRLTRQGPVSLPETVSILDQCCRALTRAHSLGIVHRDIKPDNIYLAHSVDDATYVVKVLDFGIAKFTVLDGEASSATRTGVLLGTPLYMSPEQARGLRGVDARSDIYSLGLVVYTMLTGRTAFNAESLGDLLLQVCVQPLPSLLGAAPWLPPAMEEWFQMACAREPDARFPTAQSFLDALRTAAGGAAAGSADGPSLLNRASAPTWDAGFAGSSVSGAGVPAVSGPIGTTGAGAAGVPRRAGAATAVVLGGVSLTVVAAIGIALAVRGRRADSTAQPAVPPTHPAVVSPRASASELPAVTLDPIVVDAGAAAPLVRGPFAPAVPQVKPTVERGPVPPPSVVGGKPPAGATTAKTTGTIDLGY